MWCARLGPRRPRRSKSGGECPTSATVEVAGKCVLFQEMLTYEAPKLAVCRTDICSSAGVLTNIPLFGGNTPDRKDKNSSTFSTLVMRFVQNVKSYYKEKESARKLRS